MSKLQKLTEGGIEYLHSLEPRGQKEPYETNVILQVVSAKLTGNKYLQGTLSDTKHSYTGFIMPLPPADKEQPKQGDILKIETVSVQALAKDKTKKVFFCKTYEILGSDEPLVGNVIPFEKSKRKFEQHQEPQEQPQHYPRENMHAIREETICTSKNVTSGGSNIQSGCQLLSHITTFQKDIKIFVKIIKKFVLKYFTSKRDNKQSQLISFITRDVEGNEMQGTAFGDPALRIDKEIKEGHVYVIQGGYAKVNDRKFSTVNSDYRLNFDENTRFTEVEDTGEFKEPQREFTQIRDIEHLSVNQIINITGIIIDLRDRQEISTKTGVQRSLRRVSIGDSSEHQIELTLWGQFSEIEMEKGNIIEVVSVRISEYNGTRNLNSIEGSKIRINPNDNLLYKKLTDLSKKEVEFHKLSSDSSNTAQVTANLMKIADIKKLLDETLDDNLPVVRIKGVIVGINHSDRFYYPGCPDQKCRKKAFKEDEEKWTCNKCHATFEKPAYYYTLNLRLQDCSGERYIDVYGEPGEKFFGVKCEDYRNYVENKNTVALKEITDKCELREYIFIGKPRNTSYNEQTRQRFNVFRIEEVDEKKEMKELIKFLKPLVTV